MEVHAGLFDRRMPCTNWRPCDRGDS